MRLEVARAGEKRASRDDAARKEGAPQSNSRYISPARRAAWHRTPRPNDCRGGGDGIRNILPSATRTLCHGWDAGRRGAKHSRRPRRSAVGNFLGVVAKWTPVQRSADGAVAPNAGRAVGCEKASDIEKVHARGVHSDGRPTMYRTHTGDPWSALPVKRVLSNIGSLSRCGLSALGATGSSADLTGGHAARRTPATSATPATNVTKGGTPRSPARAKKAAHLCPSKAKAARNGHPGRWVGRQSVSEPMEEPQRRRRNTRDTLDIRDPLDTRPIVIKSATTLHRSSERANTLPGERAAMQNPRRRGEGTEPPAEKRPHAAKSAQTYAPAEQKRRAAAEHGREGTEAHRRKAREPDMPDESHGASRKKARTQPPMRWNSPQAAHAPEGGESGRIWDGRAAAKGERMAAIAERSESGGRAPRRSAGGGCGRAMRGSERFGGHSEEE